MITMALETLVFIQLVRYELDDDDYGKRACSGVG